MRWPPRWLVSLAVIGAAGSIAAYGLEPHTLLISYLAVVVTVSAIPVGALAVLMMTYLVRGAWTEGLHVPLAAAVLTMPLAGVLFVPVLIGLEQIYPWAGQPVGDPGTLKAFYLTPLFFSARILFYFAVWTALGIVVRRAWTNPSRMIAAASAGLVIYALTASFAGIDWLESLTPDFHSSIYGLLFLTFQLLTGLAFALVVVLHRPVVPTFRYGAILFSTLLLWGYNHAMQYIIIWSGNIPEEAIWYTRREAGAWGIILWALVILQFVVPFFAMLFDRVRTGRRWLLAIAGLTLGLRFLESVVLALPGANTDAWALALALPGTIMLIGAVWWIGFRLALSYIESSAFDRRGLGDDFDAAGSAASTPGRAQSGA